MKKIGVKYAHFVVKSRYKWLKSVVFGWKKWTNLFLILKGTIVYLLFCVQHENYVFIERRRWEIRSEKYKTYKKTWIILHWANVIWDLEMLVTSADVVFNQQLQNW